MGVKNNYKIKSRLLKHKVKLRKIYSNDFYITNSRNKSKAVWEVINNELGTNKKCHNIDESKFSCKNLVDTFNEHYCNVTRSLNLKPNSDQALKYTYNYIKENPKTIYLNPTTEKEICEIVRQIKNKPSTCWDESPIILIKNQSTLSNLT